MQVTKFVAQMQLIQAKVDNIKNEKTIDELMLLGHSVDSSEQMSSINSAFSNNEVKAEQQEETKNEEQTVQQAKPANTETESTTKKRKTRKKLVLAVLAIALLIIYIVERGEFLEIKEIGE